MESRVKLECEVEWEVLRKVKWRVEVKVKRNVVGKWKTRFGERGCLRQFDRTRFVLPAGSPGIVLAMLLLASACTSSVVQRRVRSSASEDTTLASGYCLHF